MIIDIKRGKFTITCDFSENRLLNGLVDKRFDKRKKCWTSHALSKNSQYLLDNLQSHMTDKAVEVAQQSVARSQIEYRPFPREYIFKTRPISHQWAALDRAYNMKRFAFFMEMGTGKTKTAIDLMSVRKLEGHIENLIVFCPVGVVTTWVDEVSKHCPFDWPVIPVKSGKVEAYKKIAAQHPGGCVIVAAYESIKQQERGGSCYESILELAAGTRYGVVIDESHYVKSHNSNTSVNVEFLTASAHTAVIMTGTEITDGFMDLYMQFKILDPNIVGIGDYYSFKSRYAVMGGYKDKQIVNYQNTEELLECISPYIYQCRKADVLDLPEKMYTKRYVDLSPEQARVIRDLSVRKGKNKVYKTELIIGGAVVPVEIDTTLAWYAAMQQISGGFVNYDHILLDENLDESEVVRRSTWLVEPKKNPKILELINIANENPHKQIIVWAAYRNEIAMIVEALSELGGCSEYHGGISKEDREVMKTDFLNGKNRFFISNTATGGTGITLVNCDLVVYYSNSWKYVDRVQSEDRAHRIGQHHPVTYVDIVANGSKDLDILKIIEGHGNVAQFVKEKIRENIDADI